jgi:hypothetical protein
MKCIWRILVIGLVLLVGCSPKAGEIAGVVVDENGPVAGAVVRVQTTEKFAVTDDVGAFTITNLEPDEAVSLTAWAEGYFITGGELEYFPGETDVRLELIQHATADHQGYPWLSAYASAGKEGNCQKCHASEDGSEAGLPFDEWVLDAHANSALNQRFLTMYAGTDMQGNQSPLTRRAGNRDYGAVPLAPDKSLPYYGPGYKLDFPDTSGNCSACHAPAAAIDAPYGTDPRQVSDVGAEGVACDFCHKVWAVRLNLDGLPYQNMPGVLSFDFLRPEQGHQFFAGPYDDVAPGEDTYSPLQQQSEFCAPCHYGFFWDTLVYNSFGEWLDSPYADPETGRTCQDCHMPAGITDHFATIQAGGRLRDPETIFSHLMLGVTDEEFMRNAVSLDVEVSLDQGNIVVTVAVINDNTGHHIPTDSPLRQLILIVQTFDEEGNSLTQLDGPTVPEWGGVGDPGEGYYAGLPGTGYAKILAELWTEVSPTGAYWNQTRVSSDTRIPAMETSSTSYIFAAAVEGAARVEVRLIYRRAFIELADQKGWEIPDLEIANFTMDVLDS